MTRFLDNAFLHKFNENLNFKQELLEMQLRARARARVMITSSPIVRSLSFSELWFKTKIPPDVFFIFLKNWQKKFYGVRCKKIVEKNGQKFWYFLADRKIFIFHFFDKNKKRTGGILVVNLCFERLSDWTIGDKVIIVQFCTIFDRFFQNGHQIFFFSIVDPKYICMPKMKFIGKKMKKKPSRGGPSP